MPLELNAAGTPIPINVDELKDLKSDLQLALALDAAVAPYLVSPLSALPDDLTSKLTYSSPEAKWAPLDSTVSFTLRGGVAGSVEVVKGGEKLLSYIDGLESPKEVPVLASMGNVYLRLSLNFQIAASGSGTYSGGLYGVKAGGDTQEGSAITLCKAFEPTVLLGEALAQTFQSFVLPFTSHTLTGLGDGDYLAYEFDGNVKLAVGAYAGVDKVLYAGHGSADVLKAFGDSVVTLSGSVAPEVKAAAAMDFKLSYATRFDALLGRVGDVGRLQLFKSSKKETDTTLSAGLTISANGSVDVKQNITAHWPDLKATLVKSAGGATSAGGIAVGAVVDTLQPVDLQQYVDEVTDKLTNWIDKANDQRCNLQIAIESSDDRALLAGYTFDLKAPDFTQAWNYAIAGDLSAVIGTKAATLDVNSGLEQEYRRKTSCQCNFFNLWSVTSWDEFRSTSKMVYAGNNVFHVMAEIGRTTETDYVGAKHSMDIYFAASADAGVKGAVSNVDISLHIAMNAMGDTKQIQKMANMLRMFDSGSDPVVALADGMNTFAKTKGAAQLLFRIPGSSFTKIVADPKSGNNDAANWTQFASAADQLNAWVLRNYDSLATQYHLKTYPGWEILNMAFNESTVPDRNSRGNPSSHWPEAWSNISDTAQQSMISYSMLAGQHYMNFCGALQSLAQIEAGADVAASWATLLQLITDAIKKDMNPDFLWPTALATIRTCKGVNYVLTGPVPAALPAGHFMVSVDL